MQLALLWVIGGVAARKTKEEYVYVKLEAAQRRRRWGGGGGCKGGVGLPALI